MRICVIAGLLAFLVTPLASAQSLDQIFPAPATDEFGPHAEAPDGLDIMDNVVPAGGSHVEGEGAPDPVGAFRFTCGPGHVLADDPVVYPGKPGVSHVHQFYGNLATNGKSTYESQRALGVTSCGSPLNRSGYWMPALISGDKVLRPYTVIIYYKRQPKTSARCKPGDPLFEGECVGIPNALRFIFGYDMLSGTVPTGAIRFICRKPNNGNAGDIREGSVPGSDMVLAGKNCQVGDILALEIDAPPCWDGVNLDRPNHRSHMANSVNGKCPSTHPKLLVHFMLKAFYVVDANWDNSGTWEAGRKTWYLSSDIMYGMAPHRPGSTYHTDYFEGWNARIKKAWTDNCIDKHLNCSFNDLGNGYSIETKRWGDTLPKYLPIPAGIRGPYMGNMLHSGQ